MIFVFGSNLAGRHGKGAALHAAKYYGAQRGIGIGPTGDSYAIPTKDENLNVLPLWRIQLFVSDFIIYARSNRDITFQLTAVGCGLAGYKSEQIAPMFTDAPENVIMPDEFIKVIRC